MSNSIPQQNRFAEHLSQALVEYLKTVKNAKIEGDQIYKFSMKVWFDVESNKVKSLHISEVDFKALNKALNKHYRKAANE